MSDDLASDSTAEGSQDNRRLVKSKVPNLFVMLLGGVYYGRVEVNGRRLKK
jgi:hypothetical protein